MSTTPTETTQPRDRKPLTSSQVGVVTRDSGQKTRTVTVAYRVRHPKYGKFLQRQSKFHVHDAQNVSKIGDRVEIANCRPISKTKSWRLVRVVEAAPQAGH